METRVTGTSDALRNHTANPSKLSLIDSPVSERREIGDCALVNSRWALAVASRVQS
jgi:hypothetical protein